MVINDSAIAFIKFRKELSPDEVIETKYFNRKKHRHLTTKDGKQYYIIFKREPFHSFSRIFNNNYGFGESLNQECLLSCVEKEVDMIIIIYQSGRIYGCSPKLWKQEAENNKWIRKVHKSLLVSSYGKKEYVPEVTYSIPLKFMIRYSN